MYELELGSLLLAKKEFIAGQIKKGDIWPVTVTIKKGSFIILTKLEKTFNHEIYTFELVYDGIFCHKQTTIKALNDIVDKIC